MLQNVTQEKLDLLCAQELFHYINYQYKVISLETVLSYKHSSVCTMQCILGP